MTLLQQKKQARNVLNKSMPNLMGQLTPNEH